MELARAIVVVNEALAAADDLQTIELAVLQAENELAARRSRRA